jgi:MFS-type transporter involved in bile tolerance (Atg22 family)
LSAEEALSMPDKAAGESTCFALASNESLQLKVTHAETLHIVFLICAPWFFVLLLPRFRQRLLKTLLKSSKSVCKQGLIYAHVAGQEAMVDFAGEWRD